MNGHATIKGSARGRRTIRSAAIALASAMTFLCCTGPVGAATVLCKKKNGVVIARDTCKPKETAVTLANTGPQVVDSAGRVVGILLPGLNEGCNLLRPLGDGTAVGLTLRDYGVQGCGSLFLYETSDCTGTPYLIAFLGFVRSTAYQDPIDGQPVIYYASGPIQQRTIQSASYDMTGSGCSVLAGFLIAVGQATKLDLSSLTLPFSMP